MPRPPWSHRLLLPALLAAVAGLGCGAPPPEAPPVPFSTARESHEPVTIEGRPAGPTVGRTNDGLARFTLRELEGDAELTVVAPQGVAVPANLPSAERVIVTGRYDAAAGRFIAASVEAKVPPRERQPHG